MNNYALAYTRGSFSLAFPVFPSQFPNTRVVFKPTQPTTILISINFFLCFFLRLSMSINLHDDDEFFSPLLSEIRKWTGGELSCLKTSNSLRNKNFCLTNKKGRSRKEKLDSEFYFEARKSCIHKSDKIKSLLEWFSIFLIFFSSSHAIFSCVLSEGHLTTRNVTLVKTPLKFDKSEEIELNLERKFP